MDISLSPTQQQVFDLIKEFLDNDVDIFILKGYAGTGKTTMIKFIVEYLLSQNKTFEIMAPTGRAAKVLRSKMNHGHTIHSSIYSNRLECKEVENEDKSKKSFRFYFPLIETSSGVDTVIVDECSMISDVESHNEFYSFGSGRLLTDLLNYIRYTGVKNLILIGDPAQLPPVGDARSRAFDEDYLTSLNFKVQSVQLTEVIRQAADSPILKVATDIRDLLEKPLNERRRFTIDPHDDDIINVPEVDLAKQYVDRFPIPQVNGGVVICFSNRQCYRNNIAIRDLLFPDNRGLTVVGDVLLINANNYSLLDFAVFNGDMAVVTNIGADESHRNIPVTINNETRHITLTFRNVTLLFPNQEPQECLILVDLLDSEERDISIWQMRALYIDFCMRIKQRGLREGSEDFKKALLNDRYFNCLKVKYAYSITCHKAQGGEWDTVFVDYTWRCGLNDDSLRWCYTATTRARNRLLLVNPPQITEFSKLKISPITRIGKAPKNFWGDEKPVSTPFHNDSMVPMPVKLKCLGIIDALQDTPYTLQDVQSLNYQERYVFMHDGQTLTIPVYYDGASFLKTLPIRGDGSPTDFLNQIINTAMLLPEEFEYHPSNSPLKSLWQVMQPQCDALGITIVNVIEDIEHYNVIYCLLTDARFALIQFYFSINWQFTAAMPKSEMGAKDEKLNQLITSLS